MRNTLFIGDNLLFLRDQRHFPDASVDLIYLDPPFNSNRSYNVLFREESGKSSDAQIEAFDDTWHWPGAVETYHELVTQTGGKVGEMIGALHSVLGGNQMMAYLVMMAARLVELHRVLKPTGSLYLHCDPTASHYLKVVLDCIFGAESFRNEIVWQRAAPKGHAFTRYPSTHDILLSYGRSNHATWHTPYVGHREEYIESHYSNVEPETGRRYTLGDLLNPNKDRPNLTYEFPPGSGSVRVWRWTRERMMLAWQEGRIVVPKSGGVPRFKRYLDEMQGTPVTSVWTDIPPINSQAQERLGYPTQKPLALLERIINASSNPGDVVLDPFAGCGTTIAAAEKLGRTWIGIDITHLAANLLQSRLKGNFGKEPGRDYDVVGQPVDLESARALFKDDAWKFQLWALGLVGARAVGTSADGKSAKKGADRGIDGKLLLFDDEKSSKPRTVLVQVKGGGVKSGDIRDLRGTMQREDAIIGLFITLEKPSRDMLKEAAEAGLYESGWGERVPRLQILTVESLLRGTRADLPAHRNVTLKQAQRIPKPPDLTQGGLDLE